ncbi:MobF family relaxase [Ornithinimicrobium murale]|uniref:MobF family relaxase n=1 Tax=Ornithinimicrobium murale TaxID=1050153 RepID=UPI000E0CCC4A|nr:MobF family relaxase [Ornithinimicrobium murale]
MSIHKLTAGSGYDYLTRQVAAQDVTEKGHSGLATYYTERGETPGQWIGSGMAGIDGLDAGDVVTAEQMQALFGSGHHPLAEQRRAALEERGASNREIQDVTRLGTPFKVFTGDVDEFRRRVAGAVQAYNTQHAQPVDAPIPDEERARIRTEVGGELFRDEFGREPRDARELSGQIAKYSRPRTTAVAGFDLTFSPVKSISALWAVADEPTAAAIELAHQGAVQDALSFLENHGLYTRTGTNGVRQVDTRGLVAAAFTHRDSRAGDPDLHTHVAVANKVQTAEDGRWLSVDARILYKATVTASETYNTSIERRLRATMGLRFTERADLSPGKRPIREIDGVDVALNQRWSSRRVSIQERTGELAAGFQADHGRPPTAIESVQLAQQATLETREAKHEPRTLAQQREAWHAEALDVLGEEGLSRMLTHVRHQAPGPGQVADTAWVYQTADTVLEAMQSRRSTWQVWHVRAEAQRQVRSANIVPEQAEKAVDLIVSEVLQGRCVALTASRDGITEPDQLRRADGASVYSVAGADLFTSQTVLDAEHRIVAMAGRFDGFTAPQSAVDVTLLESTANGITLNAGQSLLVSQMATSPARLALAIAPAGSGKTTAMQALSKAWTEGGGTVVGLAPSAGAAAVLREQIGASTDTLAKLTWGLSGKNDLPDWAETIGPKTLVVIDEAGMADTISLDAAIGFVTDRGGSVRLVGDDQQLAAIGAGGVLRDIQATHGASHLSELMRFTDPAEAGATLALRDGRGEALGFYLDNGRVHVGDLAMLTDDVFTAWHADRAAGKDTIMLAPTRELASELNQRARAHRLQNTEQVDGPVVPLADGNRASVGDLVITRQNQRSLRLTPTDFVKNGDRWTVKETHHGGALTVQHTRNGRHITLPAAYVRDHTELGYASTIHAAQGISTDTVHGLATSDLTRQQLYTMLSRGGQGNHLYLPTTSDGDPHNVIRAEAVHPPTATDLLEDILARDGSSVSASTMLRRQDDPSERLPDATERYVDALYYAAEDTAPAGMVKALEDNAEQVVPGLTDEAAWPALRAHLLLHSAHGVDPLAALKAAAGNRELDTAADRAAVLDWRLDDTGHRGAGTGPLPWAPAIPNALSQHHTWGPYLNARAHQVSDLAEQVHGAAADSTRTPVWARHGRPSDRLVGDIAVWRAATRVPAQDLRPTGRPQLQKAASRWQGKLSIRLGEQVSPELTAWVQAITAHVPLAHKDSFTALLAEHLQMIDQAGLPADAMLDRAAAEGPLPDDHPVSALWWRISEHVTGVDLGDATEGRHPLHPAWADRLGDLLGQDLAQQVHGSHWWPQLITAVERGMRERYSLEDLVNIPSDYDYATSGSDDLCQVLVWRAATLLHPEPGDDPPPPDPEDDAEPSEDLWQSPTDQEPVPFHQQPPDPEYDAATPEGSDLLEENAVASLGLAALVRQTMGPVLEPDAAIERQVVRATAWDESPVSRERMVQINQWSLEFYESQLPGSWGQQHLVDRLGQDITGDARFRPGQAPAGWTHLVDHLRGRGISDEEMVTTGVATTARNGNVIDRFRDRVVFPIVHEGDVLAFVGRRHPDATDADKSGPKYLNTPATPLFDKSAQLYGPAVADEWAIPVLVEGPIDAIAVTLASNGTHVGYAPLGTSLTEDQAIQIARGQMNPIVATDADQAGAAAAERAYWLLTPHGLDPTQAPLPQGADPASILTEHGPARLHDVLLQARPLGQTLLDERLTNLPAHQAQRHAAQVLAARPGTAWATGIQQVSNRLRRSTEQVTRSVAAVVQVWNTDPLKAASKPLQEVNTVRQRLSAADPQEQTTRWAGLAADLDPRLPHAPDWPALAAVMQSAQEQGHDVAKAARALVSRDPLGPEPALEMRHRLQTHLPLGQPAQPLLRTSPAGRSAREQRRSVPSQTRRRSPSRGR